MRQRGGGHPTVLAAGASGGRNMLLLERFGWLGLEPKGKQNAHVARHERKRRNGGRWEHVPNQLDNQPQPTSHY